MGGLFGGTTKTTSKSEPWKPQGDALKTIFGEAGSIYDGSKGTPFYQGDLYANMDPATSQAVQGTVDYVNGQGAATAGGITSAGNQLLDPTKYQSAIDAIMAQASTDPTKANIAAAQAYANNPALDGAIDAASRDVTRNLSEVALPTIDRVASASGNINSSRAGVASGIAQRGAADQIGDISATMRAQAYNTGLGLAEQARTTNLNATGSAAGLYGSAFGQGVDAATTGNNLNLNNLNAAIAAGQLNQQDEQGQIDADYSRWQGEDTRKMDLLNRYYQIIGANNWGGTQTNTQKTSGNIFGTVAGLGMTAAGLGLFGGGGK